MTDTTWLDYVTAIGVIATPILVLLLTAVGWRFRVHLERRLRLDDSLREDRTGTYNQILEPFVMLLMTEKAWQMDPKNRNTDKNNLAMRKMLSLDYRSQAFRLSLVGSDGVVKSYNNLMQSFYQKHEQAGAFDEGAVKGMMQLLGSFLLEIRRSMGNG